MFKKIELFITRIVWLLWDKEDRKPWEDVVSGAEKHEHNYTKPTAIDGEVWYSCSHKGCSAMDYEKTEKDPAKIEENRKLLKQKYQ